MSPAKQVLWFLKLVMKEIYTFCLKDIWKIFFFFFPFCFYWRLKWINQTSSHHFPCFIHCITCGVTLMGLCLRCSSVCQLDFRKVTETSYRSKAGSGKQSRLVWRWRQMQGGAVLKRFGGNQTDCECRCCNWYTAEFCGKHCGSSMEEFSIPSR